MSCFIMRTTSSRSSSSTKLRSWRWWRMSAARIASAARSRIRRRHQYGRSFAPVYVDELYSSSKQQPKSLSIVHEEEKPQPSTNKARRRVLVSPMRGGGVCMGEVDLRAEVFIRKFREEMRLQSQRSAEEFHAMLARGL